jgi:hypothetical protein
MAWGAAVFLVAGEGVALAYARDHGQRELGGVLMASVPAGGAMGAYLLAKVRPFTQVGSIRPLAVAACLPLLLTGLNPPVWCTCVLWFVGGACQGFMVPILATVNLLTAAQYRGRVNGLGAAGFSVANACSFLLVGYLADQTTPATAVALAGLGGLATLVPLCVWWPTRQLRDDLTRACGPDASLAGGPPR